MTNEHGAGKGVKYLSQFIACLVVVAFSTVYVFSFCRIELNNLTIGFGDVVYSNLKKIGMRNIGNVSLSYGSLSAIAAVILLSLIYPLDVVKWGNSKQGSSKAILKSLRAIFLGLAFLSFTSTCLLIGNQILFAPYLAFIVISVGTLTLLKLTWFNTIAEPDFFRGVIIGLTVSLLLILGIWCTSLAQGNLYNFVTRLEYHSLLNCPQGRQSFAELKKIAVANPQFRATLPECSEAYLIYISPFILIAGCAVFIGALIFLNRARQRVFEDNVLEPSAQVFIALVLLSIFGLWVAASLSTITKALASSVLTISCVLLAALLCIWFAVFGVEHMVNQLRRTALGKKGFEFLSNDWGKSLLVFTSTPLILLVFGANYVKQLVRRKTGLGKHVEEVDKSEKFTPSVRNNFTKLTNWEQGSILPKVLIWGMLYFTFSVGVTRIVVVVLSLLREAVENISLAATTGILVLVSITLFLLPPIPGVPVYITLGVILPDKAASQFGFIGGVAFAIFLSFLLKLLALVIQQKIIGELWGSNNVWVRQTVGINSIEIRATRKILEQPGLNFSKVVILVGGPDWPTSVLTGIMRLNVFQMILGTLPVILLIAPTVISGAMVVRANENNIISTLSTVFIFFSAFIQGFALLWAFQVIAVTAVKYEAELAEELPDEEVLQREQENLAKTQRYALVTKWINLSMFWRVALILNALLMIVSCYGFLLIGKYLFVPFEIQDSVAVELSGNVLNLVKPPGWVCLGMFAASTIFYFVFNAIFKRRKPTSEMEQREKEEQLQRQNELTPTIA